LLSFIEILSDFSSFIGKGKSILGEAILLTISKV